jgi:hypothetical protein
MAFMYWSGPRSHPGHIKAVHLNVSIIPFYYVDSANPYTITRCWLGIKLTRAASVTIAAMKQRSIFVHIGIFDIDMDEQCRRFVKKVKVKVS